MSGKSRERKDTQAIIKHTPRENLVIPTDKVRRGKFLFDHFQTTQKINADLEVFQDEITVDVLTREPIQILHLSDLHIGHMATDHKLIEQFMDYIRETPNCLVIFYGDLIEGWKADYAATSASQTMLDAGKQMRVLDGILCDLVDRGKLIAAVKGNHEDWSMEMATVEQYDRDYLRGKMLRTGGKINIRFPDGEVETFSAFHDPGDGGSDFNPVGSLRKRLQHLSVKNLFAGDRHSWGGVASDLSNDNEVVSLGATGTFNGLPAGILTNRLMTEGAIIPCPPGVATTHSADRVSGKRQTVVTPDLARADRIFRTEKFSANIEALTNAAVRNKAVEELAHEMRSRFGNKSQVRFDRYGYGASRIRKTDRIAGSDTKHWKELAYTFLDTILPVQLYFVAHYRAGSKTSDKEQLREILDEVRASNHAYVCFMRQMVDQDLAKDNEREVEVDKMLEQVKDLYGPLAGETPGNRPKILTWMYDGALRSEGWKTARPAYEKDENDEWQLVTRTHKKGKKKVKRVVKEAYYAASVIEDDRKVPLIDNKGELKLTFTNDVKYRLYLLDALGRSASVDNPQQGLRRMEIRHSKQNEPHDLIVGGNMPVASVAMLWDHKLHANQGYISPGHLAEWMGFGKQNMSEASPGGQSAIFLPDEKMFFLGVNLEQSKELSRALTIYQGALHNGGVDHWLKRLGERKRTVSHRK